MVLKAKLYRGRVSQEENLEGNLIPLADKELSFKVKIDFEEGLKRAIK